jgi:hypothetical protein
MSKAPQTAELQPTAQMALDLAAGALRLQVAIMRGMVEGGLVEEGPLRAWLGAQLEELPPDERRSVSAHCLWQVGGKAAHG